MTVSLTALDTRAIVLDVEGTTTPVEFIYEVLFPFARAHAAELLEREADSEAWQAAVRLLEEELATEALVPPAPPASPVPPAPSIAPYVHWLMDRDRKSRGLKALQGLIWQEGYRRGELRGQVFADVRPALERWRASGLHIYIYSSGSVLAQQLLFKTTNAGDLTPFLHGYFDTAVGPKQSADSYRAIATEAGLEPSRLTFVSDIVGELDAAREAGCETVWCLRSGASASDGRPPHRVIHSFDELLA